MKDMIKPINQIFTSPRALIYRFYRKLFSIKIKTLYHVNSIFVKSANTRFQNRPHKKHLAISMVKNERNIIKDFCCHHINLFDELIIVDHKSEDGTGSYLRKLSSFDSRLKYFFLATDGYYQQEVMTYLTKNYLRDKYRNYWVFFLDADEFIPFLSRDELSEELVKYEKTPIISMMWLNLVPVKFDTGNVKDRLFLVPPKPSGNYCKIALQPDLMRFFYRNSDYFIAQGNHHVRSTQFPELTYPERPAEFYLYHFPVRESKQLIKKLQIGTKQYELLEPERRQNQGFHWFDILDIVKEKGINDELLIDFAVRYGNFYPPYGKSFSDLLRDGYSKLTFRLCKDASLISEVQFDEIDSSSDIKFLEIVDSFLRSKDKSNLMKFLENTSFSDVMLHKVPMQHKEEYLDLIELI